MVNHGKILHAPKLPNDYKALEPYISEAQLVLHHTKHHQGYVNGANAIFQKFDKDRKEKTDFDIKVTLKELSFHIGGYKLQTCSCRTWHLRGKVEGGSTRGTLRKLSMKSSVGSTGSKKEFSVAASSVEGSGWGALSYCNETKRPLIVQIEKYNANLYPGYPVLMALDVLEHGYYLDYRNDRGKIVGAFRNIVNWARWRGGWPWR